MEDSKTLFCSSKFPWAREIISSKFMENLGTGRQKRLTSPALRHYPVIRQENIICYQTVTNTVVMISYMYYF